MATKIEMIVHGQKLLKTIKPPIRDKAKVIAKASIDAWVKRGADKLMSIVGEDALTNLNDPTFVKGYVGTVLAVLDAMEAIGEATRFLSKIKPAEADNYYDEIDRVIPQLYTKYPALEKAKIFEEEFGDGVLLAYSIMEGYMNNDTKFSKDTFAVKFVHEEPNFTDEETEEQENEVKTSKALLEDDPNNPPVIDSLGADKAKLAAAEPMTSINTSTVDSTEDIMASLDKEFNKSEDKPTVNVVELVEHDIEYLKKSEICIDIVLTKESPDYKKRVYAFVVKTPVIMSKLYDVFSGCHVINFSWVTGMIVSADKGRNILLAISYPM